MIEPCLCLMRLEVPGSRYRAAVAVSAAADTAQPTFSFRTFDGEQITAQSALAVRGNRAIERLRVGAIVAVLYDPQQPEWVVPADFRPGRRAAGAFFIAGSLLFIGLNIAWALIQQE